MRFYAHEGSSKDNAFTTYNGKPVRAFRAFASKRERQEKQDKLWEESNHEINLIFCPRGFVEEYMGPNFYVDSDGYVWGSYDEYCQVKDYENYENS